MKYLTVFIFFISALVLVENVTLTAIKHLIEMSNMKNVFDHENAVVVVKNQEYLHIPTKLNDCTNTACGYICELLGYHYGKCLSANTCSCYN
ncbi:hypothetical protein SFRURICE_008918 [Spodoptera frugiperda]|uniref:SFRICE_007178 n=1 Tax=Spodoptera frugiperda TaxID=7108 RepID=A0A2H1WM66_SPOFR|nr:hypothetical protein SFRURICE_008918 [Spodoptera frugiperda]